MSSGEKKGGMKEYPSIGRVSFQQLLPCFL
uniref:Uncharacterized protein n=1 Tax=Anguilla anguilla TaxID=7936 RepID=A0A0E9VLU9_ANGAN